MAQNKGAIDMVTAAGADAPAAPALQLIPPGAGRFLPPGLADFVSRLASAQPAGSTHTGPGPVDGPGGPTDDAIPAELSDGEYVLPAEVVDEAGDGDNDAGADLLDETVKGITGISPAVGSGDEGDEEEIA